MLFTRIAWMLGNELNTGQVVLIQSIMDHADFFACISAAAVRPAQMLNHPASCQYLHDRYQYSDDQRCGDICGDWCCSWIADS
jgi:hypothetical protein